MKRSLWFLGCALIFSAAAWAATATPAQSPFDGTWRTDMAQTKFSPKPVSFYLSEGWYHCTTCAPAFDVQADGQDHSVSGQSYDTLSVTVVDPHTLSFVTKKGGKVDYEQTRTVSADDKVLTVKTTLHPMDGSETETFETTGKRAGTAPSGVHAASGNWIIARASGSTNALTTTYELNGDELTMSEPTGETYTAKLDGGDFPMKGSYATDTVSLKKIDAHTIEETDKRNGAVVEISKITVNGKMMTIVDTDPRTERTSTYTAHKE
jgi:hypothetical protein